MEVNAAGLDVRGALNPRWRGGLIRKSCKICLTDFTVKPGSNAKFCSMKCVGISQRGCAKKSQDQYKVTGLACENCETMFYVPTSSAHKWRCCSSECSDQRRAKVMTGESNPNWRGGLSRLPYPWNFRAISRDIIARDGCCQNPDCSGNDPRLTTHHIDYNKQNCGPLNLIALCSACNSKANFNRPYWQAFYAAIVMRNLGGGYNTEVFE